MATTLLTSAGAEAWHDALPQSSASRMIGEGEYRWLGLRIYTAQLWAAQAPVTLDTPLALQLTYARSLSGQRLVDTSIDEIRRIYGKTIPDATLGRWRAALLQVLPDVHAGDRLTGVYLPAEGARFYANDRVAGQIQDPALARAFFAIWLDPATRAPALRRQLLGLSP
ncbi:chalcone isomerase family protein [Cupriavidus sp. YR651]|uniref:chalcone isomerase family protein n=1 Tax=Cupriavidus sp. YR651 TaxID=1855315 RepID=UPI000B881C88|nr:chalcone isomerase family protein [Cupriavidus sp. YR651]